MNYLLMLILSTALSAQETQLQKFDENQLNQLREKSIKLHQSIVNCTPYEFDVGSRLMPENKRMKSIVVGLRPDKSCQFIQTLPQGEVKTCALSKEHRQQIKQEQQAALNRILRDSSVCISSQPSATAKETRPVEVAIKIQIGTPDMKKKDLIAEKYKGKENEVMAEYEKLLKLRDELSTRNVRIDCADTTECKNQSYGHKICGGFMGSFIYSTRDSNIDKLIQEVVDLTKLDAEVQRMSNAASTCDVYEAPELQCKEGICERID